MIKLKNFIASVVIISVISLLTLLGIYGSPFFIDFSLIFDGAYKIAQGLVPFVDFSMPPIPVSLYIPAFFQIIFGSNLFAMAMMTITLSSILSLIFYKFAKEYFSTLTSIILSIAFYFCFAGILIYPWYNQIAFFFFLLNFFLILNMVKNKEITGVVLLVSCILTILAFFSKMEIGGIQLVVLSMYFFYAYKESRVKILTYFIAPTIIGVLAILKFIAIISNALYFRFGGEGIISKLTSLLSPVIIERIIFSFSLYLILVIIYLLIITKNNIFKDNKNEINRLIFLLGVLNIFVIGATVISGLAVQTKLLALPLTLYLIYLIIINKNMQGDRISIDKKLVKSISVIFLLMFILVSINFLYSSEAHYFKNQLRQAGYLSSDTSLYFKADSGCYKGAVFETSVYNESLSEIRRVIESSNKSSILLLDDYFKFLNCDYNLSSPNGFPLWFHEGLTFQKKDLEYITQSIKNKKFEVIIENFMAISPATEQSFEDSLTELHYEKAKSIPIPGFANKVVIYYLKK